MRKTAGAFREEKIKIVGGSTFGRYPKISAAKTYNLFISDNWLINTAGYEKIIDLVPEGEGRALFRSIRGNILIAVVSQTVFSINTDLAVTVIGTLATSAGEVFIDENLNSQICIVDGINAYIYNYTLPPNLTIQALAATLTPNYVEYHNTFFLFGNANTTANGASWFAYQFSTPTTIVIATPGQFALQTKPDFALAVVRLPSQGNNVLVMGSSVCEIWTQIGGLQNYRRNSTINVDYGVISVSTIARSDKYVGWLSVNEHNTPVIMFYSGQGFEPVSSSGIDYVMSHIKFPAQSTAMFYKQDGHLFYQLTFFNPVDNVTFLFDVTTKNFFHLSDANLNFHPAREFGYFINNSYFISLTTGGLYESSTDFTTYDENLPITNPDPAKILEIPRIRICDSIQAQNSSQFRANSFAFTIEQGTDPHVSVLSLLNNEDLLITENAFVPPDDVIYTEFGVPIADEDSGGGIGQPDPPIPYQPRVDLSISRDGGETWSNWVGRNLNPIGIRQNILNWENMGLCNSLTIKLRFWSTWRFIANDGVAELV